MESIKPERMFGGVKEALDDRGKKHTREDLFPKIRNQRTTLCNVFIEKKNWNESKEWLKRGKEIAEKCWWR